MLMNNRMVGATFHFGALDGASYAFLKLRHDKIF